MSSIPIQAGLASVEDLCPCFHRAPRSAQPPLRGRLLLTPTAGGLREPWKTVSRTGRPVPLEARRAVPGRAPRDSVGQPPR